MARSTGAYARAGVDIDNKMLALKRVKSQIDGTAIPGVLGGVGSFGGLFVSPGKDHVLVASTDGVGTKLKVAVMAGRHDTVGQDIVNHCVNDILVQGAQPLFFLDYIGTSRLNGRTFQAVVKGLAKACRRNGCALLGGETAEMPGLYPPGEYDLVGTIVGAVARRALITGEDIRRGDAIIGLPSNGLHTNGFSLARKVLFERAGLGIFDTLPGTRRRVADVLLAVHTSYLRPVRALMRRVRVRGIAHITGGGFFDNVPRILPENTAAVLDAAAWRVPPVFRFIQDKGRVSPEEMYRVFNMGLGIVLIVRPQDAAAALRLLRAAGERPVLAGNIRRGRREVVLENLSSR